jgi:hypothetical protein
VKQNFSAPDVDDRWFRYVSVELPNQQPPIYPAGDKVAVVEVFQPGVSGPAYPPAMISDALKAIDSANPPLSPSKQAKGRYAVDVIAHAIAHHRGGKVSDVEAEGVLGHIQHSGLAVVQSVKVPRPGSRIDVRPGFVVTPEGMGAMQAPDPAGVASTRLPQSPQSSRGNDAGLSDSEPPKGSRSPLRGCGGNAGTEIAGESMLPSNKDTSKVEPKDSGAVLGGEGSQSPLSSSDAPAPISAAAASDPMIEPIRPSIPERVTQPIAPARTPSATGRTIAPGAAPTTVDTHVPAPLIAPAATESDDLTIPPFLRRPLPGPAVAETAPSPDSRQEAPQSTDQSGSQLVNGVVND